MVASVAQVQALPSHLPPEGKDSRGRPLPRPGAQAWERLDHDLDSFVENFHTFVRRHRLPWGAAAGQAP